MASLAGRASSKKTFKGTLFWLHIPKVRPPYTALLHASGLLDAPSCWLRCGPCMLRRSANIPPATTRILLFGPAEAERLREFIFLAGGSGIEPFSPTVRLGDSEL